LIFASPREKIAMKKIGLCALLAIVAALPVMGQGHAKAPDAVVQAFSQTYQQVTGETWHKMASGNWYADLSQDSLHTKVEYTPEGSWVATRTALDAAQLPDTLHTAIQQQFPGATIEQATRIQRADVAPYYNISLTVAGTEKDILANDQGTITE
jgi:hypothetical protein